MGKVTVTVNKKVPVTVTFRRKGSVSTYRRKTSTSRKPRVTATKLKYRRAGSVTRYRIGSTASRRNSPRQGQSSRRSPRLSAASATRRPRIMSSGSTSSAGRPRRRQTTKTTTPNSVHRKQELGSEEENNEIEELVKSILKRVDRVIVSEDTEDEEIVADFIKHKKCKSRCRVRYVPCTKAKEESEENSGEGTIKETPERPSDIEALKKRLQLIKENPHEYDLQAVKHLKDIFLEWSTEKGDISEEDFEVYRELREARDAIRGTTDTESNCSDEGISNDETSDNVASASLDYLVLGDGLRGEDRKTGDDSEDVNTVDMNKENEDTEAKKSTDGK